MSEKTFKLTGPETVTLSAQTIDKLVRSGDGDAALLFLYMQKTQEEIAPKVAASAMNKSVGWVNSAMAKLSMLGLINANDVDDGDIKPDIKDPIPEPRRYTADEIKQELESRTSFAPLLTETQRSLGRVLTPDDLERLYNIYDSLNMPAEVIMLLITHCINDSRKGVNWRMPSLRNIEKVAYEWEREGITSLERAEEYLKILESRRSVYGQVKQVFQIYDRELTTNEKNLVDEWTKMGFGVDAIEVAYERTIAAIGKPALGYIKKIIENWHGRGLHTVREIDEKDTKPSGNYSKTYKKDNSNKFGTQNREDLERMQRLLDKIKDD